MGKIFWSIWLLVLVLWTATYSGLITESINLINNFNNNVVVFLPSEFKIFILLVGFGLIYKIYQSVK